MKLPNSSRSSSVKKYIVYFLVFSIFIICILFSFRINKFEFKGDLEFFDLRALKIFSINYLKDQPIFWFNKTKFENQINQEFPQIQKINYKIISSDTLEIYISAQGICCIVSDSVGKKFIIAKQGEVLREYEGIHNIEFEFISSNPLKIQEKLNENLISIIYEINNKDINFENVSENKFFLESNLIYFFLNDGTKIIINENTDFKKFENNLKNIISYLTQNEKNYSILDFRFEKIVVK